MSLSDVEMARVVLTASATVSAMLLGVIGVLVAIREAGRGILAASLLPKRQRRIYIVVCVLILAVASTLCAFFYLAGHGRIFFTLANIIFPISVVGTLVAGVLAGVFTK